MSKKVFKKFMQSVVDGLVNASQTANEIGYIYNLIHRPIGIIGKSYNNIRYNLSRNIGNNIPKYDGYGTPIGSLSDPFYNENNSASFFYDNIDKRKHSNYLDYIDSIGINNENLFMYKKLSYINDNNLKLDNAKIVTKSGLRLNNDYFSDSSSDLYDFIFEESKTDLKNYSDFILNETLKNSIKENYKFNGNGISSNAYQNFGINGYRGFGSVTYPLSGSVRSRYEELGINNIEDIKLSKKTINFINKSKLGLDLLSDLNINLENEYINNDDLSYPLFIKHDNQTRRYKLYTYGEPDGKPTKDSVKVNGSFNKGTMFSSYETYSLSSENDIINKTNNLFNQGKINTLISRFHSNNYDVDSDDSTSTAISKEYGMSHGRNLLKENPKKDSNVNGYDNPYCRVWTYHHQYSALKDCIRPLDRDEIKKSAISSYRTNGSLNRLFDNGVKGDNGLVIFAPTIKSTDGNYGIKKCMFSIENLAWKGEKRGFDGHQSQKGPFGGRIMWFPPYDLKFNENVNVNWNQTQFIGRGESIYTYTNTERSGNLSFKLLIDHPSVLNSYKDDNKNGDVDDIDSNEQKILRFFAGCGEIIQPSSDKLNKKNNKENIERKPKDNLIKRTSYKNIVFYVFFPNDYSGIDDKPNGYVSAMEYLINGTGTNKTINNNNFIDIDSTLSTILNGYEMSDNNIGISNIGNKILGKNNEPIIDDRINSTIYPYKAKNKNAKMNYWGYRVDEAYKDEVLIKNDKINNYCDVTSFGLNNKGYKDLLKVHTDSKKYLENGSLYSFCDVFSTIEKKYGNVNKDLLNMLNNYNVKNVEISGYASSHGTNNNNNSLSRNRAKSVMKWLNKCMPNKFSMDKLKIIDNRIGKLLKTNNVSDFNAKIWRCVKVVINLETETVIDKSLNSDSYGLSNDNLSHYSVNLSNSAADNSKNSNYEENISNSESNVNSYNNIKELSSISDNENKINSLGNKDYNEYEYFKELKSDSPFLHRKIVDKIKYFDPAFHSITPEGFQARLTFLHQCTRQGNTNANSDDSSLKTASNLSFGRPPICVLRIGDFYYTKIIIESLSINYDDGTWDLNDEGIGVMPMMANVNIAFKFLGGSDLTGPITRLQNALSFNHYANTFTYDDRAEEVEYKDGKITKFKSKN